MRMRRRYKVIIIAVIVIIFASLFVLGQEKFRSTFPQAENIIYNIGEKGTLRDDKVELKIKNYKWMGQKEFEKKYGKFADAIPGSELKMLLVETEFYNKDKEEHVVEAYNYYIETLGYCNGVGMEGYSMINKKDMAFTLKAKQKEEIILPYTIFDFQFRKNRWKKIEKEKFYLTGSWYPVKKRWSL